MKAIFLIAAAALVAPSVAVAAVGDKDGKKEKKICKAERETGTRLGGKKICMTQAEWDKQHRQNQADLAQDRLQQVSKSGM